MSASLKTDRVTHFADSTGHNNRMQSNEFARSLMYSRGVIFS